MPTDALHTSRDQPRIEQVPIETLVESVGTPCYAYSYQILTENIEACLQKHTSVPHHVHYAVKANSNLAILKIMVERGMGFDIVSGGELARVLRVGASPDKIVYSGVGKTTAEIKAALEANILAFQVESPAELTRIEAIAEETQQVARISIRVNPDISVSGHEYLSTGSYLDKFGIDWPTAHQMYQHIHHSAYLSALGISCHIGSQILELTPLVASAEILKGHIQQLRKEGITLSHVNVGGGLGIAYTPDESPPSLAEYLDTMVGVFQDTDLELHLEPGRAIVGPAGFLLTTVEYLKQTPDKAFAIVDASMAECLRPSLYNAFHQIIGPHPVNEDTPVYDVVGPVCESGDFLGRDRPLVIQAGDTLVVKDVGAYGMSMASNYNSRPFPPEVLVHGEHFSLIRERQTVEDILAAEQWALSALEEAATP